MAQCRAVTAKGTRCFFACTPPSKSLCGKHQNALARGTEVHDIDTGRRLPAPRK